jgi:photosystem I subunit 8
MEMSISNILRDNWLPAVFVPIVGIVFPAVFIVLVGSQITASE